MSQGRNLAGVRAELEPVVRAGIRPGSWQGQCLRLSQGSGQGLCRSLNLGKGRTEAGQDRNGTGPKPKLRDQGRDGNRARFI